MDPKTQMGPLNSFKQLEVLKKILKKLSSKVEN
jgi:hypothetical protein